MTSDMSDSLSSSHSEPTLSRNFGRIESQKEFKSVSKDLKGKIKDFAQGLLSEGAENAGQVQKELLELAVEAKKTGVFPDKVEMQFSKLLTAYDPSDQIDNSTRQLVVAAAVKNIGYQKLQKMQGLFGGRRTSIYQEVQNTIQTLDPEASKEELEKKFKNLGHERKNELLEILNKRFGACVFKEKSDLDIQSIDELAKVAEERLPIGLVIEEWRGKELKQPILINEIGVFTIKETMSQEYAPRTEELVPLEPQEDALVLNRNHDPEFLKITELTKPLKDSPFFLLPRAIPLRTFSRSSVEKEGTLALFEKKIECNLERYELAAKEIPDLLNQMGSALAVLEKEKIMHGNIHPVNIVKEKNKGQKSSWKIQNFEHAKKIAPGMKRPTLVDRSNAAPEILNYSSDHNFEKVDIYTMGKVLSSKLLRFSSSMAQSPPKGTLFQILNDMTSIDIQKRPSGQEVQKKFNALNKNRNSLLDVLKSHQEIKANENDPYLFTLTTNDGVSNSLIVTSEGIFSSTFEKHYASIEDLLKDNQKVNQFSHELKNGIEGFTIEQNKNSPNMYSFNNGIQQFEVEVHPEGLRCDQILPMGETITYPFSSIQELATGISSFQKVCQTIEEWNQNEVSIEGLILVFDIENQRAALKDSEGDTGIELPINITLNGVSCPFIDQEKTFANAASFKKLLQDIKPYYDREKTLEGHVKKKAAFNGISLAKDHEKNAFTFRSDKIGVEYEIRTTSKGYLCSGFEKPVHFSSYEEMKVAVQKQDLEAYKELIRACKEGLNEQPFKVEENPKVPFHFILIHQRSKLSLEFSFENGKIVSGGIQYESIQDLISENNSFLSSKDPMNFLRFGLDKLKAGRRDEYYHGWGSENLQDDTKPEFNPFNKIILNSILDYMKENIDHLNLSADSPLKDLILEIKKFDHDEMFTEYFKDKLQEALNQNKIEQHLLLLDLIEPSKYPSIRNQEGLSLLPFLLSMKNPPIQLIDRFAKTTPQLFNEKTRTGETPIDFMKKNEDVYLDILVKFDPQYKKKWILHQIEKEAIAHNGDSEKFKNRPGFWYIDKNRDSEDAFHIFVSQGFGEDPIEMKLSVEANKNDAEFRIYLSAVSDSSDEGKVEVKNPHSNIQFDNTSLALSLVRHPKVRDAIQTKVPDYMLGYDFKDLQLTSSSRFYEKPEEILKKVHHLSIDELLTKHGQVDTKTVQEKKINATLIESFEGLSIDNVAYRTSSAGQVLLTEYGQFILDNRIGSGSFNAIFSLSQLKDDTIQETDLVFRKPSVDRSNPKGYSTDLPPDEIQELTTPLKPYSRYFDLPTKVIHFTYVNQHGECQSVEVGSISKRATGNLLDYSFSEFIPPKEKEDILLNISSALAIMYEQNIRHRDCKVQNVLIFSENGKTVAKIGDWGSVTKGPNKNIDFIGRTSDLLAPEFYSDRVSSSCEQKKEDLYAMAKSIWESFYHTSTVPRCARMSDNPPGTYLQLQSLPEHYVGPQTDIPHLEELYAEDRKTVVKGSLKHLLLQALHPRDSIRISPVKFEAGMKNLKASERFMQIIPEELVASQEFDQPPFTYNVKRKATHQAFSIELTQNGFFCERTGKEYQNWNDFQKDIEAFSPKIEIDQQFLDKGYQVDYNQYHAADLMIKTPNEMEYHVEFNGKTYTLVSDGDPKPEFDSLNAIIQEIEMTVQKFHEFSKKWNRRIIEIEGKRERISCSDSPPEIKVGERDPITFRIVGNQVHIKDIHSKEKSYLLSENEKIYEHLLTYFTEDENDYASWNPKHSNVYSYRSRRASRNSLGSIIYQGY